MCVDLVPGRTGLTPHDHRWQIISCSEHHQASPAVCGEGGRPGSDFCHTGDRIQDLWHEQAIQPVPQAVVDSALSLCGKSQRPPATARMLKGKVKPQPSTREQAESV